MTKSSLTKQSETTPDPQMTGLPADAPSDPKVTSNRRVQPPTPRWVKVAAIIVIVLVVLFVVLHFTGLSPMGSHMNMGNMLMSPTPLGVPQP